MPSSLAPLAPALVTFLSTYLLHSTLLLGGLWLCLRLGRRPSHALSERLWKWVAVASLISTPLQLSIDASGPVLRVPLFRPVLDSSTAPVPPTPTDAGGRDRALNALLAGVPETKNPPFRAPGPPVPEVAASKETLVEAEQRNLPDVYDASAPNAAPVSEQPPSQSKRILARIDEVRASTSGVPAHAFGPTPVLNPKEARPSVSVLASRIENVVLALIVLYCGGSLLLLVWQNCLFRRKLAACREITYGPVRKELAALIARLAHPRAVTLLRSDTYPEPIAFGFYRWRILLPDGIEHKLPADELRALLAHELAHLARGDQLWLWIGRLLSTLFCFQPLNRLARREWQRAAEFQCDDWAVRHAVSPLSLARCLTRVAEWRLQHPAFEAGLAAAGTHSDLSRRVERLIDGHSEADAWLNGRRQAALGLIAACLLAALTWYGPRTVVQAETRAAANASGSLEADVHENDIPDGTTPSQDSDASTEKVIPAVSILTQELDAVDHEFGLLERDWESLLEAANRPENDPEVRGLIDRLQLKMNALSARRNLLKSLCSKTVFPVNLGTIQEN